MKGNRVDVLNKLIMSTPIVYCIGTASRAYPEITADTILSEIQESPNPNNVIKKYGLLEMYYNGRPIGFDKEDLLNDYGGHLEMLCPFHLDAERGSFKITPSKNMWWCFSCTEEGSKHTHGNGRGGSQINFEMDYFELNFVDAVYHLAYRLGFINAKEYKNRKIEMKINEGKINDLQRFERREYQPEIKADPSIIHNVYSAMQSSCPLSPEDKRHLIEDRGLDESDLINYFTYPDRRANIPKRILNCIIDNYSFNKFGKVFKDLSKGEKAIIRESKAINELIRQFRYVPGFYYNNKSQKHESVSYRGIGLLSRDYRGRVVGVQIRRNDNNGGKGARYLWLSSAFAQMENDYDGGASPGSPGGIIYPKNKQIDQAALCITEGRFKAEQIAKDGNVTVYLSGVSTWKNIQESIMAVKGNRDRAYIMFDADMMGNTSVHAQLRDLCEWLKSQQISPYLIVWRKELGKGYDDLKLFNPNDYKRYLKVISFYNFEKLYNTSLNYQLKRFGVERITDIDKSKAEDFTSELQNLIENNLNLPKKGA